MAVIRSLKFKMVSSILLIFLILLILLFYDTFYTKKYVKQQLIDSERVVASLYMEKIDSILSTLDQLLLSSIHQWAELGYLIDGSRSETVRGCVTILKDMETQIAANEVIQFFYAYMPENDTYIYRTGISFDPLLSGEVQSSIIDQTKPSAPDKALAKIYSWQEINIGGKEYIYQSGSYQNFQFGMILDINKIFSSDEFYAYSRANTVPVFVTASGIPLNETDYVKNSNIEFHWDFMDYYMTGIQDNTIVTGVPSMSGDFGLMVLIPNTPAIFSASPIHQFLIITFLSVLIYIVILLLLVQRFTLSPLAQLKNAMLLAGSGNIDIQVPTASTSEDFCQANRSFNQMIAQIKALKIEAYEKQLAFKNLEIEQLKMQINPHLFLNSLSLIHQLNARKSPNVSKAVLALMECFRYFVRQKESFVTLKCELEYTDSYRYIQELTFPGRIHYHRNVPFFLEGLFVPTMTVLEFIENSIKYALPLTQELEITIDARLEDINNRSFLIITIEDNGPGFDEEILAQLRLYQPIIDKNNKQHIGILNYAKRIRYLYNGTADLTLANKQPHGAQICIRLPVIENNNWTIQDGGLNEFTHS